MKKLAHSAMLDISDAEKLKNDIEAVLNTIKILDELDENEVIPYLSKTGDLREDEVLDSFERDEMLKNTVSEDGYIVVPRVVEK